VNPDGTVEVKQEDGSYVPASEAKITMIDELTERDVTFSKVDAGQGNELKGAKITVSGTDANGQAFTETWTSDGTAKVLKLKAGEYKMVEDQAPLGYDKAAEIEFRVNPDGSVEIKENGEWVKAKEAKVQMVDKLKTTPPKTGEHYGIDQWIGMLFIWASALMMTIRRKLLSYKQSKY